MQYATVFRDGPFYDVPFGSREPRAEIQWNPTREELTAKFLALSDGRRRALTWDEAWGFVMPYDERELSGFQQRQALGVYQPWEAVARTREIEVPRGFCLSLDDYLSEIAYRLRVARQSVDVPPEANPTALLLG